MNRLQFETSPYLLQHKDNPVDWYPWGMDALERAKNEDKPILLSIGYSSCHWCHVMAHESFEDPNIAEMMNRYFVNIKVDREERPDIDSVYMNFVQLTTGSGGWPLTVAITPDMIPFFGGTYYPPEDKYGRPGFPKILHALSKTYKERKDEIIAQKDQILEALNGLSKITNKSKEYSIKDFDTAYAAIYNTYDDEWGGFGSAPKFPQSMTLMFLLRYYTMRKNPDVLSIAENTLQKMASGGIYDQIGGGFHRYSTDAKWLVPHFEKMLYDNALLSRSYLEAWQLTKNVYYRAVAEDILDYVIREMTDESGGFYSAQDADSEGEEGKFYVWTFDEISRILDEEDLELAVEYYGITREGNFEGNNIATSQSISKIQVNGDLKEKEIANRISGIRKRLFRERDKRVKPGLDNKILTNWNAMMLNSFILAAGITGKDIYKRTAIKNAEFLWNKCFNGEILYHTSTNGVLRFEGNLDDYSLTAEAFISMYQLTFDEIWIFRAGKLIEKIINNFYDEKNSDFYFSSPGIKDVLIRTKEIYDNAVPGANSVTVGVLLRAAKYLNNPQYEDIARKYLEKMHDIIIKNPLSFSYLLISALYLMNNPKESAIVFENEISRDIVSKRIYSEFIVNSVIMGKLSDQKSELALINDKSVLNGRTTFYVCSNFTCKQPVSSFEEFQDELNKK